MSAYDWSVYRHNGTAWVELTNVQGLAFNYGLQNLTESWSPPVWTLTGRLPDENGTVRIGDWISIIESGSPRFIFQVTNYEVFYGIEPSMDTWSMTVESGFSALGRSVISASWVNNVGAAVVAITQAAGLNEIGVKSGTISAQTVTDENGLDTLLRVLRTSTTGVPYYTAYPSAVSTASSAQRIGVENGIPATIPNYFFTDETPSSIECVYDVLNFGSVNLNYATKVVATPVSGSPQTVGSGNNAFETTTYSATNVEAIDVANRYLGLLAASGSVPLSLSFTKEQQSLTAVLPDQEAFVNPFQMAKIRFRSSDFYASVIGQQLTSTPGSTRVTLYLCASENNNFFTLDNAVLGVLNQNRLGI